MSNAAGRFPEAVESAEATRRGDNGFPPPEIYRILETAERFMDDKTGL